ncbi:hypothetical protein C1876_12950 [Eggerthella sinensis]|uniref:Uncharacterized protein n=1 Tax=Eggerthella sinensis TaxID=242230 RepID=A0A3N0IWA9_9ACTN|nr:hypothetical protein C1876_12950 [Eggerthella sinensis]RNM40720.1 hypothetical protein DMP09_12925 [Eggerthella sinensis]
MPSFFHQPALLRRLTIHEPVWKRQLQWVFNGFGRDAKAPRFHGRVVAPPPRIRARWRPLLPFARGGIPPLIGAPGGLLAVEALRAFGATGGFAGRRAGRMFDKHAHRHAMVGGHDGGHAAMTQS